MKRKKFLMLFVCFLVVSTSPVSASQISGTNGTFNEDINDVKDSKNSITDFKNSINDDLGHLQFLANKVKLKNIPWYVLAAGIWPMVAYLASYFSQIKSSADGLKDKCQRLEVIGSDINGTRYGLEEKNETVNSTISAEDYAAYMQPKIESLTGYRLNSLESNELNVGDIVLYKSKNLYYRYLYISKIDGKNGNYILRGMNNKIFVKNAYDSDGNIEAKFRISSKENITRDDDLKVVNAAYKIQKNEFMDRRNSLSQLKDESFQLTQMTEVMRGVVTITFDSINAAISWAGITGVPAAVTIVKDLLVFAIMMLNEYCFKPLNNLAKDLLGYFDLEIPDLQEFFQAFQSPFATAHDMHFTISNTKNITANLNAEGSSLLDYQITKNPTRGNITLSECNGGHNGTFVYSPDPKFTGNVSFKYKAGNYYDESNEATVTIEVIPGNMPVSNDMNLVTSVNGTINSEFNVTNDNGNALNYFICSDPTHGNISLNSNGSFVYRPDRSYSGNDSFTYKVNNGFTDSRIANVKIIMDNPPVTKDIRFNLNVNEFLYLNDNDLNATDLDGDKLQFNLTYAEGIKSVFPWPKPGIFGNLSSYGDNWKYNPDENFKGQIILHYQAYDGFFWSNVSNVTINYR